MITGPLSEDVQDLLASLLEVEVQRIREDQDTVSGRRLSQRERPYGVSGRSTSTRSISEYLTPSEDFIDSRLQEGSPNPGDHDETVRNTLIADLSSTTRGPYET